MQTCTIQGELRRGIDMGEVVCDSFVRGFCWGLGESMGGTVVVLVGCEWGGVGLGLEGRKEGGWGIGFAKGEIFPAVSMTELPLLPKAL